MIQITQDELFQTLMDCDEKANDGAVRVGAAYKAMAHAVLILIREKEIKALESEKEST